jgi:Lamin Tail Domain/PKD domain
MYDPDGTDTGREWIEVQNVSTQSVDLSKWKLFEEGVNHSLSFSDGPSLSAGAFAIITTDRAQFSKDYPVVQTKLIQASFSLKNTGESVGLKNESGSLIEEYVYQVSLGGAGNGESIQKLSLGYAAGLATPGAENASVRAPEQPSTSTTPSSTASSNSSANEIVIPSSQSPYKPWPSDRNVYVTGGGNRVVVAGADSVYEARALGIDKKPLENVNFYWTFGDGGTETGRSVRHYFRYPGTYVVLLDAISGDYISSDHIEVLVIPPEIEVTGLMEGEKGYIELANNSEYELDLSGWILETGGAAGGHFVFPKKSLILPHAKVKFPNDITKLTPKETNVRILFPNSEVVYDMSKPKAIDTPPVSVREGGSTVAAEQPSKQVVFEVPIEKNQPVELTQILPSTPIQIIEASPIVKVEEKETLSGDENTEKTDTAGSIQVTNQTATPDQNIDPRIYLFAFVCTLCIAAALIWYAQKSGVLTGDESASDEADEYEIISKQ